MDDIQECEIMTIEEVATYLRIPVSSAYKLAHEGKIPAQKVGRHWRFYRPAIRTWISGSTAQFSRPEHPIMP